jgi:ABC-2 type transport system permease protein
MANAPARRIAAIARKELWHIVRDWQTLLIALAMPVLMMFLYGYALNMDLTDVPVLVEDPQPSPESNQIVRSVDATTLFAVVGTRRVVADPLEAFRVLRVKAILRFSPTFAADLRRPGAAAGVQVLIDGSDPTTGTILRNVMEPLLTAAALKVLGLSQPTVVTVHTRVLYNPEQKSALYFVPGLMAIILLILSAMLTSLAITREKERGTMEQLLVSPLRPHEVIVGKLLPYVLLAALDGAIILLVGRLSFGVHVSGSLWLLALAALVYIFTALAIGLLISTIARTQQQAMMIVLPATLMPTVILSGFIFPIASLPLALRLVTCIVPATYFLQLLRGIILKGVGLAVLWQPLLVLALMGVVVLGVAIRKYRVQL